MKRTWARIICAGSFLFPRIRRLGTRRKLPQPCIVVCNHTSYLDIVFSPFYVDHTAVFMGKHELLKVPLFGNFFRYLDIPVNRRSLTDAHRAFVAAGRKLDEGISLVIYPEGTISPQGKLKAFKNGAFRLAIEKQLPVVPVANLNNWKHLQNGGFFKSLAGPGFPQIVVGEPISTTGWDEKNVEELKAKVVNFISEQLQAYGGKN